VAETLEAMRSEMLLAAEELDFERAAKLRDRIASLSGTAPAPGPKPKKRASSRPRRR